LPPLFQVLGHGCFGGAAAYGVMSICGPLVLGG
jgi:hypothetical protein